MRIVLVRHGIAEELEAGSTLTDSHRRLTKKGRKQMKQVAKGLRRLVGAVDIIATSPYTRAVQTAEVLRKEFDKKYKPVLQQVEALKSGASSEDAMQWITSNNSDATVLLVGHEPDLSILLGHITSGGGGYARFSKGGACLIDYPYASTATKGKLLWMATPAMFKWLGV